MAVANYRKLTRDFWTDSEVMEMLRENRQNAVLLLLYSITGFLACADTAISGIYEISRGAYQDWLKLDGDEVDRILDYFNDKRPHLLEYDKKTHMVFVKNLYKHNSSYKPGKAKIEVLNECFEKTYSKAPKFWLQFGIKYKNQLEKTLDFFEKTEGNFSEKQFILTLLTLKEKPNPSPNSPKNEKLSQKEFFLKKN